MQISSYKPENAAAFAQRITPFLMHNECENSLILGLASALIEPAQSSAPPPLLLSIESQNQIVGVAVQTRPIALAVTRLPSAAIDALVNHLAAINWSSQGIVGPAQTAEHLASAWARHSCKTMRLNVSLRVFQLAVVTPPAPAPGKMIAASQDHLDLLTQWHEAFSNFIGQPDDNPRQSTQRLIDEHRLYIWHDGHMPCSMAATAGRTPNGIRVNHVYTPPEFRNHGFASNLVAALSQHMLDTGRRFCFLFTDLANPTSNKIYQQIGYKPGGDFGHWVFDNAR